MPTLVCDNDVLSDNSGGEQEALDQGSGSTTNQCTPPRPIRERDRMINKRRSPAAGEDVLKSPVGQFFNFCQILPGKTSKTCRSHGTHALPNLYRHYP